MTLHQGKGEMLATVFAAHVIEHISIENLEEIFGFVPAMRALYAEHGYFGTHVEVGND
ncbi:hypothetical protein [Azohydromonas aeria]|uniref:hypothetical protein n=1 Tax=Azohydromonas aeria TaxID=2590212 RepID=UPI0012FA7015|nr:hypothetical protein [Azohydromonas aeria]